MTEEEEARIGPRPRGGVVLGLLLREPKTDRIADLNAHPAAIGFPPQHPPMRSFLGVPIISRGRVLGNFYLTEKRTASEFSDGDARVVECSRDTRLAIENARLYTALGEQQRRLQLLVDQMPEAVLIAGKASAHHYGQPASVELAGLADRAAIAFESSSSTTCA